MEPEALMPTEASSLSSLTLRPVPNLASVTEAELRVEAVVASALKVTVIFRVPPG